MMMHSVLVSFVITFLVQFADCQIDKFTVAVFKSSGKQSVDCLGTVISDRHILTTASCAQELFPNNLTLKAHRLIPLSESSTSFDDELTYTITKTFVHPQYTKNDSKRNNIGILMIEGNLNTTIFKPRPLGGLDSNGTCTLYATATGLINYNLTVLNPQSCNSTLDQAYCSKITINDFTACGSTRASPVSCKGSNIDGFLISENGCDGDEFPLTLYYHSVSDFSDWIREVSGAEMTVKMSMFVILSAALINFNNFL